MNKAPSSAPGARRRPPIAAASAWAHPGPGKSLDYALLAPKPGATPSYDNPTLVVVTTGATSTSRSRRRSSPAALRQSDPRRASASLDLPGLLAGTHPLLRCRSFRTWSAAARRASASGARVPAPLDGGERSCSPTRRTAPSTSSRRTLRKVRPERVLLRLYRDADRQEVIARRPRPSAATSIPTRSSRPWPTARPCRSSTRAACRSPHPRYHPRRRAFDRVFADRTEEEEAIKKAHSRAADRGGRAEARRGHLARSCRIPTYIQPNGPRRRSPPSADHGALQGDARQDQRAAVGDRHLGLERRRRAPSTATDERAGAAQGHGEEFARTIHCRSSSSATCS